MKWLPYMILWLLHSLKGFSQLPDSAVYALKNGQHTTDSSYIYTLPYAAGKSHLLIQGYNSKMSHKNELSLDFKMKKGSLICAARDGVVIETREDSKVGGLKDEYLSQGNHIIIQHSDGSIAWYWHLQYDGVLVNTGDTVSAGQLIGRSGNTGYTAFPHLHFQVFDKDGTNIATRFYTKKGIRYLRPAKWYRRKK